MDPLAVLAYGAEQAPPLIVMEWNHMRSSPTFFQNLRNYQAASRYLQQFSSYCVVTYIDTQIFQV